MRAHQRFDQNQRAGQRIPESRSTYSGTAVNGRQRPQPFMAKMVDALIAQTQR
jgi:hypothetical protein